MSLGDTELLDDDWTTSGAENLSAEDKGVVERTDDGALRVTTGRTGTVRAESASVVQTAPVLATEGFAFGESGRIVSGPGGDQSPAEITAELPGLPLVGGAGLLGDLPSALYGSGPTVPAAEVMLLAGADTPAERAGPAAPSRGHGADPRGDRVRRAGSRPAASRRGCTP